MSDAARDPQAVGSGRYSGVAIVLHWLIAAAILVQVALAGRMEGPSTPTSFAVAYLHMSIGITILALSLARLAWRLINPPPPMPQTLASWERALARWVHVGFYVVMIAMPLTGWIMVSASRVSLPFVLYGHIPFVDLPLRDLAPGVKKIWHEVGETGHGLLAKLLYVLAALHVAGALKHQWFGRDEPVLARMAPGAAAGRRLEPRLLLILLAAAAVFAAAKLLPPPAPGVQPPPVAVKPLGPGQAPVEAQDPH